VATTKAFAEGLVTTASVMVPCPWFPEIAAWSAEHPEWDLGLHLTLTSEWRYYRWRPVAPVDKVPTLVDPDGFLWRSVEDVKKHASPEHVEMEIRAQIARARQFGMKPTHVDSHMGTLFSDARFFEAYTRVAKETGLLPMLMEPSPEINLQAKALGLDYPPLAEKLRSQGFLLLDRLITGATVSGYEARKKQYHDMIRGLKPGVTEIILHLAGDDEEIRAVTGNWAYRWHEYRIFTDADTKALIREQKIKLIGYRQLAALWNKSA
jgi:predicted glycoside hydrolase/deacetylase ChbG (UPF0249 family)